MTDCKIKYPVLFLHGFGFHDWFYWGQNSTDTAETWCANLVRTSGRNAVIDGICEKSGAEKVNIIAHSKGGLEARYLVSSLGMENRIASVTTLCTPHHGSVSMDKLLKWFPGLIQFGSFFKVQRIICEFRSAGKKPGNKKFLICRNCICRLSGI